MQHFLMKIGDIFPYIDYLIEITIKLRSIYLGAIDNITVLVVNFEEMKFASATSADVEANDISTNSQQMNAYSTQDQDFKSHRSK